MKIIAYLYDKIGGNAPEDSPHRLLRESYDSAFLVGWYLLATCAILYAFTSGIYERRSSAK